MPEVRLSELLRVKIAVREELASKLDRKERKEALDDRHAHREPRPCGLTVHPGRGCTYACIYCYVEDMGMPRRPEPSRLSGLQLAYAIASNPYTLLGKGGTFLAFGSVTEPFLPAIKGREDPRVLGGRIPLLEKPDPILDEGLPQRGGC